MKQIKYNILFKFFEKYNKIKAKYGNNIDLCAGIEFGEPHLYVKELEEELLQKQQQKLTTTMQTKVKELTENKIR